VSSKLERYLLFKYEQIFKLMYGLMVITIGL